MLDGTLVELQNVGVKRESRWLVRGVSFTVDKGEIEEKERTKL